MPSSSTAPACTTPASRALRLTRLDGADLVVTSGPEARWRAATLDSQGHISLARLGRDGALETETPAQSAARAPVVPLLVLHDAVGRGGPVLRPALEHQLPHRGALPRRASGGGGGGRAHDRDARGRPPVGGGRSARVRRPSRTDGDRPLGDPGPLRRGPGRLGQFPAGLPDRRPAPRAHLGPERAPGGVELLVRLRPGRGRPDDARRRRPSRRASAWKSSTSTTAGRRRLGDWTPHPQRFPGRALRQLRRRGAPSGDALRPVGGVRRRRPGLAAPAPPPRLPRPPAGAGAHRHRRLVAPVPDPGPVVAGRGAAPHRARLRAGLAQVRPADDRRLPRSRSRARPLGAGLAAGQHAGLLRHPARACATAPRSCSSSPPSTAPATSTTVSTPAPTRPGWTTPPAIRRSRCRWRSRASTAPAWPSRRAS